MTKNAKKTAKTQNVATVETVAHDNRAQRFAAYRVALADAFNARKSYEVAKDASNTNIQSTLSDMMRDAAHDATSAVLFAANVNADFINRSERKNARFNVYAAQKVLNVAEALAKRERLNHYTSAILRSALALRDKMNVAITHKDAASACSLDVKSDANRESHIVKYDRHIAANTAATQSSSSINALLMFDILRETRENNATCYALVDSEVTRALIATL